MTSRPKDTDGRPLLDAAVVTCSRDLPFLRLLLASYVAFARLSGTLFIFCDGSDVSDVEAMPRPVRSRIIAKQSVRHVGSDDFRNQMLIKLQLDAYCHADFIWSLDSDYILIDYVADADFFSDGKPVWIFRDWDNEASLKWRAPTEAMIGFALPHQFMDRAQYVFDSGLLEDFRKRIDLTQLAVSASPPSEYMAYGAFCHRHHPDRYEWQRPADEVPTLTYCVTQRAPTYDYDERAATIADAATSRVCVFWSGSDFAEVKMVEFLKDAVARSKGATIPLDLESAGRRAVERLSTITSSKRKALEEDRAAKDHLIHRLTENLAAIEADRCAKADLIERLTREVAEMAEDRRAKDELIARVIDDRDAIDADRRAKDELIERLVRETSAIEADRRAKDELIARVIDERDAIDADRQAKDEVIERMLIGSRRTR